MEKGYGPDSIRSSSKHKVVNDTVAHEGAQLRIKIRVLMNQFAMMNSEKVNAVGTQGKTSRLYDFDLEEEKNT